MSLATLEKQHDEHRGQGAGPARNTPGSHLLSAVDRLLEVVEPLQNGQQQAVGPMPAWKGVRGTVTLRRATGPLPPYSSSRISSSSAALPGQSCS